MKLTTNKNNILSNNPIVNLDKIFDNMFNTTPLFHNLNEIYKTGDQVRFSPDDESLTVQIDLPGVKRDDIAITSDTDQSEVYIKAKRDIKTLDGTQEQTYNRSFTVGREYDIKQITFVYQDGLLEIDVPRRQKEQYLRTHTL
jgi:HSP20 family protein